MVDLRTPSPPPSTQSDRTSDYESLPPFQPLSPQLQPTPLIPELSAIETLSNSWNTAAREVGAAAIRFVNTFDDEVPRGNGGLPVPRICL